MRILMVVPTYLPATRYGGPIESVHGLSRGLSLRGHDVHVFTTNVDGPAESDVPLDRPVVLDGVTVHYFASRLLRRLYRSPEMDRALRSELPSFDIVHAHSIYLWPTAVSAKHAFDAGVPFIISPRGMLVRSLVARKSRLIKTLWLWLVETRNFQRASAIHLTSRREMTDAEEFSLPLPRPFVIPNGIDIEEGQPVERPFPGDSGLPPTVLFLGRISWKKRVDQLIQATAAIPGVHLIIAGNDEEQLIPSLAALSRAHGVEDRVKFHGWADSAEKQRLLRRASVLVLPSLSENFGNVVLEAMAAGLPVITTPEVGAAEIVEKERAGLIVEGTAESIAEAIRTIVNDPETGRRMGSNGARAVRDHYTWNDVAALMESEYTAIVSEREHIRERA